MKKFLLALFTAMPILVSAQTVEFKSANVKITGGTITGTTVSKVTITAPATSATLTIANGKTATVSNSLTLAGTDSTTMTFPTTSASVARTDAAQTFTGLQTFSTGITNTGNITTTTEFRRAGTPGAAGYMINQLNAGSNGNGLYWNGTGTVSGVVDGGVVTDMTTAGLAVTGAVSATTRYNVNGVLHVSATAPTVSGFGTSPSVANHNGTSAFTVNVGTGGTANTGTVTLPTATTGWVCMAQDVTTPASFVTAQTGGTTTTATFTNYSRTTGLIIAWTASDILRVSCFAY